MSSKKIKVAIVGASGYLGGELLRLLLPRADVDIATLTSQSHEGKKLEEVHSHLASLIAAQAAPSQAGHSLSFSNQSPAELAQSHDAIFFALPHGASMDAVAQAYAAGGACKLIDLSGDFRLPDASIYEHYYKTAHWHLDLLKQAVYGLPELGSAQREKIKSARLIASPGCFATTAILAVRPFAAAGLLAPSAPVIIDAATGSSGSGAHPSANTHHPSRAHDFRAYEIFTHRHTPEIEQYGLGASGAKAPSTPSVVFTPHSGPWVRGIYATAYLPLHKAMTSEQAQQLLASHYAKEPFVRVMPQVHLSWVSHTNQAHLAASTNGASAAQPMAIVTAALDNLTKGGAGQAVQSFNLAFGLPETSGLQLPPAYP